MSYTKAELIVLPIALITMILITVLLYYFLKDKPKKIQDIPFQIITILLIVGEIIKQILEFSKSDGYDFWAIPLHFCSTYFFWFALAEFSKDSFKTTMENVAFVASVYLVVGFYAMPKGIIGSACENIFENYSTFHTFFFHHLVILYFILGVAFKRYNPKKQYVKSWIICFSAYFILATTCAHLLNTNYFNLLESSIPLMESFRLWAGQIPYTLIMAFVTIAGGAIFILISWNVSNKKLETVKE
ncbi:MAG: hypothetical protein E7343_05240 [Clostridiales bacterium]|nr:hypothetical protein [Clostridiales bacterium]